MEVQPFDRTMLEIYLQSCQFRYSTDADGDFVIQIDYTEQLDCALTIYLIIEGENRQILVVRVLADKPFPKANWLPALTICNQWNQSHRWPKAFTFMTDSENADVTNLVLEQQLNLEQGVHQQLLDTFINSTITGAIRFWQWLNLEQNSLIK